MPLNNSPRTRDLGASQWLAVVISLALATLTACGGGSTPGQGGGGGGGGGNPIDNVCNSGTFNGTPASPQANTYFGMHIHSLAPGVPWPGTIVLSDPSDSVQFGGVRFWDDGTGWADTNTAAGVCNFSHVDEWLSETQANNADILYDLARTPTWASSNPNDSSCSYTTDGGDGQCDPPSDLNSDGSGEDAIWIGWVTSVVSRYKGQIKYYEIWNEWNINNFWVGTIPQLVRMTQDARCVIEGPPSGGSCNSNSTFPSGTGLDPNARVITPAPVGAQTALNAVQKQMTNFLAAQAGGMGAAPFVDIVGFHCYVSSQTVGDYPVPEDVLTVIGDLDSIITPGSGIQGDPLFCTEGGWGQANLEGFNDPDLQAGFLARYYLLQNPMNIARVYWYAWDTTSTDVGALWNSSTLVPTEAATAYAEVYNWITGATPTGPCAQNGNVWTCAYTRPGGYQGLAVWNGGTGSNCYTNGAPQCSTFTIPSQYTMYRDLSGNETSVPGSTIAISAKPILLETGALP